MWIILMICIFLILLVIGFPIFVGLIVPSIIYTVFTGTPISSILLNLIYAINKWPLVAIPLFILAGSMINESGAAEKVFKLARVIFRNRVGYSLRVNVVMNLVFAGISGSMLADIGGLGLINIEAAEKEGFDRPFASALTVASAILGPTFPPSIPLIIYAYVAQVSAVRALIAGVFPALVIAAFLYAYCVYTAPRRLAKLGRLSQKTSQQPPVEKFLSALLDALPVLALPPVIIYSLMSGLFSPTEAGAATVGFAVLVAIYYHTFNKRNSGRALIQTLISTVSIMSIVAAGQVYSNILVVEGLSDIVTKTLLGISHNPLVILLIINLLLLIVGCFMEGLTVLLLMTPIIAPVAKTLGIDLIHLGIITTLNINIGLFTPPFGMGLYAVASIADLPIGPIVRESWHLIGILVLCLLLLTFFPAISVWLPNLIFGPG